MGDGKVSSIPLDQFLNFIESNSKTLKRLTFSKIKFNWSELKDFGERRKRQEVLCFPRLNILDLSETSFDLKSLFSDFEYPQLDKLVHSASGRADSESTIELGKKWIKQAPLLSSEFIESSTSFTGVGRPFYPWMMLQGHERERSGEIVIEL